ncbi:hypothetical protein [Streptomyces lydicamycinicus]|uniref:hypothetical protein n=1 Tax=Streptomyces lydicamycinicus TaxID=1546107 RepID=UPI003C2C222D
MGHTSQLAELARCIEEHNDMSRRAREFWAQTQEASQRIGNLLVAALSTGTSWAELNRLLETVEGAPAPAGLESNLRPEQTSTAGGVPAANEPHVPAQDRHSVPRHHEEAEQEGVPALLVRAHAVVSATPEQEMASRDLAAALAHNANTIGPDLCALLREVGVVRPNRGKIKARYEKIGNRLPGFTADCLKEAIDAYGARAAFTAGSCPTAP